MAHLHTMDVHALRNNPGKNFFDLKGCADPASAQAVEQNYKFVLQLSATLAGAPSYPPAGKFKARPSEMFHRLWPYHICLHHWTSLLISF